MLVSTPRTLVAEISAHSNDIIDRHLQLPWPKVAKSARRKCIIHIIFSNKKTKNKKWYFAHIPGVDVVLHRVRVAVAGAELAV